MRRLRRIRRQEVLNSERQSVLECGGRLVQSLADYKVYEERETQLRCVNRVEIENLKRAYVNNPLVEPDFSRVIEGYFPKENFVKDMAIKKVNKTLCILLAISIIVSFASYYFVLTTETKLNELSKQTVMLNDENTELQNNLDKLKSFKNVDATMQKNKMLQKADKVIETPEVSINVNPTNKTKTNKSLRIIFNFKAFYLLGLFNIYML